MRSTAEVSPRTATPTEDSVGDDVAVAAAPSPTQERTDWLEWRRGGVGASDVAGILGLSPWASPFSVWASKVYGSDDDRDTAAMSFGRRAEPMVAAWFHELTGLYVGGEQTRCVDPTASHRMCTIDGRVYESPARWADLLDPLGLLQIKTTSDTPKDWAEGGIPVMYQAQEQYEMAVTGAEHVWLAVLHLAFGRPDLKVYELHRDEADIALIVKAVDSFWYDHVVAGLPPATDSTAATTYATKHLPYDPLSVVDIDDDIATAVSQLATLKAQAKHIESSIDDVENAIRATLNTRTEGFHNGRLIVSHRPQKRAGIDATAFRGQMPATAAKFATETTYRVLRTHTPKGKT